MSNRDKSFTIRLPEELCDQIDMRCAINYRSRNKEIQALLVHAIDALAQDHAPVTSEQKRKSDQTQTSEAQT